MSEYLAASATWFGKHATIGHRAYTSLIEAEAGPSGITNAATRDWAVSVVRWLELRRGWRVWGFAGAGW